MVNVVGGTDLFVPLGVVAVGGDIVFEEGVVVVEDAGGFVV